MIRVAHVSTAHPRNEVRVHLKECSSLAAAGYEVFFFVADGQGDARIGDVNVVDVGAARGRLHRMLVCPWRLLSSALKIDAKIYHFHDPEILPVSLLLKGRGAAVIYDSHEDVPRAVLSRNWIPGVLRGVVSSVFEYFENFIARRLTCVVGATPLIADRFRKIGVKSVAINNFPLSSEIQQVALSKRKSNRICFLGGISLVRGVREIIIAIESLDVVLTLAGPFDSPETERVLKELSGWNKVDYRGNVSRAVVMELMHESLAGMICYQPEPNHINAYPNKLFEYMAAGLPVVASNFPLWREIVEGNVCGVCVDPANPMEISDAVRMLIDDVSAASIMGENGRRAVVSMYSWDSEEKKLLSLYKEILNA